MTHVYDHCITVSNAKDIILYVCVSWFSKHRSSHCGAEVKKIYVLCSTIDYCLV